MTDALTPPPRKNPILRTRAPVLPPWTRSRVGLGLTAAAARGVFALQTCDECGRTQYPPREMCDGCLCPQLTWTPQDGAGTLLSLTTLEHSHDLFFKERLPWRLGLVRLDAGPSIVAHLHGDVPEPPARVRLDARLDRAGRGVLIAFPEQETANMTDDRQLRELTCDPKFRRVLVTDGKSPVGQAVVRAVLDAGASLVWVGHAEPWKQPAGFAGLRELDNVEVLPLDVTDGRAVKEIAAAIGGRVDILINTAEVHRTHGIASRYGTDVARAEMDVNYFGLLRLAQEFGPAMKSRGADGQNSAVAWVNLLSVFALSNFPAHGTFSASKAAAYSLSQCLRAEFTPAAIRVVNVFPGPIDEDWNQELPPPKVAPERVAREIVDALRRGVEDVYPGDVAQEYLARYLDNPKVLERELAL
ncbi:MAG: SDR family NAD(P)-dependent oxidoreductase [Pseudomonadales bacterium]|nr:SDR family NAD(P)-dependent oxidoreductase [Pseudomonadales bacterium]MCP5183558.1 SDR family NAD(P)-dependent oxidoreductase [Pseudomonadales bacterium]